MPAKSGNFSSRSRFPDLDRGVITGASQSMAIRAPTHGLYLAPVPAQSPHRATRFGVPQTDGRVSAGAGQPAAVRAPADDTALIGSRWSLYRVPGLLA